jgi:two-component system sensor histidine kinase RpfC
MSLRLKLSSLGGIANKLRRAVRSSSRDQDIEQCWLRVSVSALTFGYVWFLILSEGGLSSGLLMGLAASSADALVGIWMILALRSKRFQVRPLRYLGAVSDNTALTIGMAGAGEGGVAVIGVYLWVTIGNGFRFGPRYLLLSYWLSLVGFGLQLILVPFWIQHRAVGIGLLLALAIVPLYVLVLLTRLTAQKDAAEQLSNAKSRFVANVSHELRTPLTGVFAVYDLLRSRKMPPDDRELVGMLGSAVKTLKTSVDAVLQMSKLEAGAERAECRSFNLWFLLQQIASLVRPQSVTKGLAWHLEISPNVPNTVVGDPEHIGHVLGNLLNNAFKFTNTGGVSLRVTRTDGHRVRFEVSDTGIGIPLELQERLFERFVQVDNSATRRHGGTGLGTSIARDLAELMGGEVGVVSAPGKGSTFWVEIPLPQIAEHVTVQDFDARRSVVVVGDDCEEKRNTVALLRTLGISPVIAGRVAYEAPSFESQSFLAVILIMSAADAAAYAETILHERASGICPWLVVAPSYTEMQRAALVRNGASGLLSSHVSVDILRINLAALLYRLELSTSYETTIPTSGIVRSLTILIADDNRSNQLLLSRILQDVGHIVRTAERGDAAFDLMIAGGLDLAILDLNMPDITGPDTIKLFRASSVGAEKLPIMILSADATPAAKQESLDAGADEFLTKPVTAAMLLAAVERLAGGMAARAEPRDLGQLERYESSPEPRSLIDAERFHALRRIAHGDAKFIDAYVSAAFADLEQAMASLRIASAANDVRAARDALHIIEGTGASLGAMALVTNCKSMRSYIAVSHDPDRAAALAELSTIYALTKSTVLAHLHASRNMEPRSGAPK